MYEFRLLCLLRLLGTDVVFFDVVVFFWNG